MRKQLRRTVLFAMVGLALLSIALVGISALSNLGLPTHSQVTDRLSEQEEALLAEAIHLRQSLGDTVWPGWGLADIPIIVYNEEYAFLVDYPSPPAGWLKMPQREARGGPWEVVPDTFEGQAYYRQRLLNPNVTPENFTVLVGERWVATIQTREYGEIAFYAGFREQLPSLLRPIFPYRLAWRLIMGETENYIAFIEHEAFHAFQGGVAPARLADAESANQRESAYPWRSSALGEAWEMEMDFLVRAVRAPETEAAADLGRQFLLQRDKRRAITGMSQELISYERQREWLEGLAKYAELELERLGATTAGYAPQPALAADRDFHGYATRQRFWSQQIDEAKRTTGRGGETRFYYSGMAQAVLLDRLLPAWKESAFGPDVMLDDLVREAVGQP